MGKRKSSKPPPKKAVAKLDTTFSCPFCNSDKSVSCQMDWDNEVGIVSCNACTAQFTGRITHLSEPVDVYSEWLDECERAEEEADK